MFEENELEQIRIKKIQAMLYAAKKGQTPIGKQPILLADGNFSAAVTTNRLLVVDFWAPWCGPCRMVGPIIEQLAVEYSGKVAFGKMNVDENQKVPNTLRIMSIPTIVIFNKGKEVERIIGAYPKIYIESTFIRYIENRNQT